MLKAVNKDKVTVTLGEDVELEEDDLTGKTITITHGKQTFTATYSDNTLTADGTAVFQLAEEELLEDAVEYKVSADWAEFANDKLVAKVAAVYIADIEFLTTGVRAQAEEQIQVIYKNQYGEDLTKEEVQELADKNKLTVTAKKGSFPLNVSFADGTEDNTKDYTKVVLADALAKDEEFTVTITNTVTEGKDEEKKDVIKAQVTSDSIKVYDENAENVASAISKLEVVEKTDGDKKVNPLEDLKAGDDFELKAEVLDQFSNIMTEKFGGKDSASLRWTTSDPSIIAFGTKDGDDKVTATADKFVDATPDTTDMVFVAQKQGTATITVFTPDGKASKSMEITVGQGKLAEITAPTTVVNTTNKEAAEKEQTIAVNKEKGLFFKNANNANVPVKAADVEFKVQEKEDSPFKASDVKIEKVVDDEGYLTAVKVTTDRSAQTEAEKAGNYDKGQDYIVEVHAKGLKQEKPATFKVNSKIDETVTKIDTETAVEFRAGQTVEQPITFTNKHGEVINVKKEDLTVTNASLEAKFLATDKDGKFVELNKEDKDKVVTGVSLTSKTKGTGSAFIVKGGVSTTIKANILDSAEIKTIDLGADIREGIIAGDDKTVLRPIVVKDQDGQEMKNLETKDLVVEPQATTENKVPTFEIVQYGKDKDGNVVEVTEENNIKVEGLALSINAEKVQLAKAQVFEAKVKAKADDNAKDAKVAEGTLKVTVNANRALDKVTIDAPQKAATVNGQLTVTLKPVDQYGDIVPDAKELISLKKVAEDETAAVKIAENGIEEIYVDKDGKPSDEDKGTLAGYKVVLDAVAKGKQEAEFIVKPEVNEEDEKKFKSVKETFTVDAARDLIESVEVTAEDEVVVTAEGPASTQLTATGKDKDGNEVSIAQDDITWSIKSVKDAKGEELTLVATDDEGVYNLKDAEGEEIKLAEGSTDLAVVSINKDGKLEASKGLTVTVEAKALTANQKEATVTVDFKGDERKFAKDLVVNTVKFEGATVATPAKDLEDKGLVIKFAAEEDKTVPTSVKLTFTGTDQYGDVFEIKDSFLANTDDSTVVRTNVEKATEGADNALTVLTIEALAEGEASVFVNYGGEKVEIAVTVTKEAAEAAELAQAKEDAKKALKEYKKAEDYTTNEQQLKQAITEGETAIDAAKDKAAVDEALANAKKAIDAIDSDEDIEAAEAAELAQAKEDAKTELKGYKDAKEYQENADALTEAIKAGETAIDTAKDKAAVDEALANAKKAIDAIDSDEDIEAAEAAELAQAKEDAKKALKEYKKAEDYTTNEQQLKQAITEGETAIDAAEDKAAVAKALADAKEKIDAIEEK